MGFAFDRAREAISRIKRHPTKCLIIHYACDSLYDDRLGLSPRINNIVVKNLWNDQSVSFSCHIIAEKLGIDRSDINSRYAEIESVLLDEFFVFVRDKSGHIWLHWNMINIQYGFETLAHRYFVLTGRPAPGIDLDDRLNIAGILSGRYGPNYAAVPHIPRLMQLNGGVRRDFVPGVEEGVLFEAGEYAALHASTACKVKFFSEVVDLVIDRKLKTETATIYVYVERATDSSLAKLVGLGAALYTIIDISTRLLALH